MVLQCGLLDLDGTKAHEKISEYDQEMSQAHTVNQPMATTP